MEIAFLIISLAGLAASGYGMYAQAQAQNAQADFQSEVAQRNAETARMEGDFARKAAFDAEQAHREKVRQILAKQKAAMASSGLDIDSATFSDIQFDTRVAGELDALAIQYSGDLDVWRSNLQAQNLSAQGQLYSMSQTNPYIASGATTLSGLGSTGLAYQKAKNAGKES